MKTLPLLLFVFLVFPSLLQAGGPWMVDAFNNSGTVARWPRSQARNKWVIPWKVDPGPMTVGGPSGITISSEAAVRDWIQPMLNEWQGVKLPYRSDADPVQTVDVEFVFLGPVDEDITAANYERYTDPSIRRGYAAVIFDHDGSILDAAGEDKTKWAGRAEPFLVSTNHPDYPMIFGGWILLNGLFINGNPVTATDKEASPEHFKTAIKHEFGHLLNLAHSCVNTEMTLSCEGDDCNGNQGISSMFPGIKTAAQYTLHVDDKVGISWLYPTPDFEEGGKFCFVAGEIQDKNGKGLQGVNVIASAVNDSMIDARSFQSGGLYVAGTEDGRYILAGLMPQVDYEVRYEEFPVGEECDIGSGYDPCGCDCPQGFGSGVIAGPGGSATVRCDEEGKVIVMETLQISLEEGRAISGAASAEGPEGSAEGSGGKKGWCQLVKIRNSSFDFRSGRPELVERAKFEIRNGGIFHLFISLGLILLVFRLKLGRAR